MKICTTEQEYINIIAPFVQKVCKRYGYLPSILIAQSCLENGYGIRDYWDNPQIEALLTYNNMVGIKSELLSSTWADKTVWSGKSLTKKTPETYNGKNVIITDDFRIYDNIEQSFADFLLFLKYAAYSKGGSPKYGDAVLAIKDPAKLIKAVHERGYATGPTYSTNVMKIVNKHNLTKYDDLTYVEPTKYTPGYKEKVAPTVKKLSDQKINNITARNKKQIPAYRGTNPIKFIVIHYLGVPNADNPDLYGGGYGGHYNIQRNGQIFKAADPKKVVVWHCGGGLQGDDGHKFYKICTNYNSIGIECGVCYTENVKDASGDSSKWYFTEETQESLVYLVSKLMDEYGISADHVIRHYDVTGKICPNPYVKNNGLRTSWTWSQFKANLLQYRKDGTITIPDSSEASAADTATDYITVGARSEEVKQMQQMLIACGYSCGSYGADGIFGSATSKALKAFKSSNGMENNDHYGEKTAAKLKAVYEQKTAKKEEETVIEEKTTPNAFTKKIPASKVVLSATQLVADTGRLQGWTYGNSGTLPPCDDHLCSCDRGPSRANWLMGFHDQRQGGETCGSLDNYLTNHGWTKVTNKAKIKAGAIVAVRYTNHSYIDHVFQVVSYNKRTGKCTKYDFGSTQQIQAQQPFKNVPLLAWGANRIFVCAWNPPSWLCSANPKQWVKDGFDYSLVFNATYYLNMYPDLKKAFGASKKKAFEHFINYGMTEGRQATAGFNPIAYRERYPDLKKAFGKDYSKYYKHYCTHGFEEGRAGI